MTEPLWTFDGIAAALGVTRPAAGIASGVSIDSRTLQPGDLFVAIKGGRMDGHNFVEAAFNRGAAAAITEPGYQPDAGRQLFHVRDTLEGLNALGRAARERTDAKVIAVTGSVGKTGTKEMLRTMLSASGPAHASEKSYNNLWGVPLSLARMPAASRFGVFEIGMNHAGEITPLSRLVRPHIAIVTWVAAVHIEFFNSVAEIADAKAEILEGFEQGGFAIIPRENEYFERLAAHARKKNAEIIPFGASADCAARLLSFEPWEQGSLVKADVLGTELSFVLPVPGRHLASNALAALAAVKLAGADVSAAAEALAGFDAPEGRGRRERFETKDGPVLLIDETYNANPASMRAALEVLGSVPRAEFGRRIAVLGDMLELGRDGPDFHAGLADAAVAHNIDLVFCAGPLMSNLFERLPPDKRGAAAPSSEALVTALLDAVRGGDAVTVKGSLGSRMAVAANALRANFNPNPAVSQGRDAA
jgi:UDP-N-acetylmuramoyl-tripeptide--D-alanyl-D-alanine ligase